MHQPLWTTANRPKPSGTFFDEEAAKRAVQFFLLLQHKHGEWDGQTFVPSEEQEWILRQIFGWKRPDGRRLYRTCYIETGRGWGKTEWAAGVAGLLLYADNEPSAEVIGAAADRDQARIALERLKGMAGAFDDNSVSPLKKRSQFFRREIRVPRTNSVYRVVSADVRGQWGASPSGIVFDEIHAQPNRELWDALVTATGKRRQPLIVAITTAGWDKESLAWELHEHTRKVAEGVLDDKAFFGAIWAAPEDADWTDPATWRQANPHLGITVSEEFIASECERAKAIPAFQNVYRTQYLSQWVGQESRLIPMNQWERCSGPIGSPSNEWPAFGGLDLSSTTDLSAFVVVRERNGGIDVFPHIYIPSEDLHDRGLRDRAPYEVWQREGLLTVTPGPTVDYAQIKADILQAAKDFKLIDVGYDRWNSSQLVSELENEGIAMMEVGQGFASMSAPTKEFLRRIAEGTIQHNGNPILRWMADNASGKSDPAGNIKFAKDKSSSRIDGLVAAVIALDGWMRRGQAAAPRKSVYDDPEWSSSFH